MLSTEPEETFEASIDLREYAHLFWSWAWLLVFETLLVGGAAWYFSVRTTPIYETSTRLLVSEPPAMQSIQYTGLTSTQTMARTYAEILVDRPVLQGVIDELRLEMSPEDLREWVSVEPVRDTQVLVVTVQCPSRDLSASIANSIASVFVERMRELQSQRYAVTQAGLAQQVQDMEAQINATNDEISRETDASKLTQLEARLTEYRRLYSNLVTNFEQVRLAEAQTSTNVVVSEPAAIPTKPVSPKTGRNTVLGAIAGLLAAMGLVVVLDALDDTVKDPEDFRKKFNLSVLGVIAAHSSPENLPITVHEPRSPVAESFRGLRTNIMFAGVDRPVRRILVTSATPQDGKTTVASNLAAVMAQGERKTVLIDADLRRPRVHEQFGLPNRSGLSDLFVLPADAYPKVLQRDEVAALSVISSGSVPPNPAELLTSQKMAQILDALNAEFEMVVFDTPPVLAVTDAVALSHLVDGVILVAKPGQTRMSAFRQAVEQLRAVHARILGVVLNEVQASSRRYGYYYNRYYSKYAHEYEEGGKKKEERGKRKLVHKPGEVAFWEEGK